MDSHRISTWLIRQDRIDKFAIPLRNWLLGVLDPEIPAVAKFRSFLHGRWLGHPLHPILVHVPVGAWTAAAMIDLFDAWRGAWIAADWAILVGLIVAIPAAIAGLNDWLAYETTAARRIGFAHLCLAGATWLVYALSSMLRAGNHVMLGIGTGYVAFAGLLMTGYLGATMVYQLRMGVNHGEELEETGIDEFVPVMALADLQENEPVRVAAGETNAIVIRMGDRVFALSDRCACCGLSLARGRLVEDCLVCPEDETAYRVEDGTVAAGPGIYAQAVFEVYISDGQIRVKAARVEDPFIAPAPISENVLLM